MLSRKAKRRLAAVAVAVVAVASVRPAEVEAGETLARVYVVECQSAEAATLAAKRLNTALGGIVEKAADVDVLDAGEGGVWFAVTGAAAVISAAAVGSVLRVVFVTLQTSEDKAMGVSLAEMMDAVEVLASALGRE